MMYNDYINGIPADVYHIIYGDGLTTDLSRTNHNDGMSIGISFSHEDNENFKEDEQMSILYVSARKEGILMLSDSRSTKSINGRFEHDDNYKKIYYSKKFKCVLGEAGLNEFDGKSFTEVVKEIEIGSLIIDEFIDELKDYFSKFSSINNVTINLFIALYQKMVRSSFIPVVHAVDITNRETKINNDTSQYVTQISHQIKQNDSVFTCGVDWIKHILLQSHKVKQSTSAEFQMTYNLLKQAITFDNENFVDSFVGGKVQAVILHPDGTAEWV